MLKDGRKKIPNHDPPVEREQKSEERRPSSPNVRWERGIRLTTEYTFSKSRGGEKRTVNHSKTLSLYFGGKDLDRFTRVVGKGSPFC